MADHLPECFLRDTNAPGCICTELRDCEARVAAEAQDNITIASGVNYAHGFADGYAKGLSKGYAAGWNAALEDGYAAGLSAARDAVAALSEVAGWSGELAIVRKAIALAAIDALKGVSE